VTPNAWAYDETAAAIWDDDILNGEGQKEQGGVFTGKVVFAFLGAIEESYNNLG
jgi:hypothetical protein